MALTCLWRPFNCVCPFLSGIVTQNFRELFICADSWAEGAYLPKDCGNYIPLKRGHFPPLKLGKNVYEV